MEEIKAEDGVAWGYKLNVADREDVKAVMDMVGNLENCSFLYLAIMK